MTASSALAFDGSHIDGGLYRSITDAARHSPHALDRAVGLFSSYGLVIFAVLMLLVWWRARHADPGTMAQALFAPIVVTAVFGVDMLVKSAVREARPCRSLPGSFTIESCPGAGDWSFPSNHTVVAFAAAAAIWVVDRRLGAVAAVAAAAEGASRVFVGVHYPHDVVAAAVLGVALGAPLARWSGRQAALVERLRTGPLRPLVQAG
ncbi:phosphatase PAP2 family protein [Streptomyces sp. V4-01]|uniref:Phosphatase PAP2 family protein n=1 Tax=Actinacidiphila polyblastidii TaxID=3110430 RepID=A0ABU7PIU9_9ACTN|nr:phosphatase PAP2 family protein [Streptomyces sp. V4-01]